MPRNATRPTDGATGLLFDQDDDQYLGVRVARIPLANANDDGFIGELENEDDNTRVIVDAVLNLTTAAGQAGTVDIGVTDTSEASADTLLDGIDVNASADIFSPLEDAGTNGGIMRDWVPGDFVTISEASGDADDLEGELLVFYADK